VSSSVTYPFSLHLHVFPVQRVSFGLFILRNRYGVRFVPSTRSEKSLLCFCYICICRRKC
jgi:hypothetical protein